ncbi:MAG TPA: hypothetical protein VKU44_12330, partial [Terriglobia bacterium]|nr:hypothetical protein [Terriglobia bacterium]
MTKRRQIFAALVAAAILSLVSAGGARAHGNEHADVRATIGTAKVSISYNRPTLKGRDLAKLIH